jgi:proteic killer suppression protein
VIVSFKHKGLESFFLEGNSSKIQHKHLNRLRLILAQLNAAKEIRDLNFPGSNLHSLKGDLKDFWSITVSGNWRIIFKFDKGEIYLVDYLDYH